MQRKFRVGEILGRARRCKVKQKGEGKRKGEKSRNLENINSLSGNRLPQFNFHTSFLKRSFHLFALCQKFTSYFFPHQPNFVSFCLSQGHRKLYFFDDPQNPKVTFFMVMFTCRNVWIEGHSFRLLTLMLVGMKVTFMDFDCHRTILLSVISLLNEPNTYSPANVDASVMYRRWRDSRGKDKEYENIIRKQVSPPFA